MPIWPYIQSFGPQDFPSTGAALAQGFEKVAGHVAKTHAAKQEGEREGRQAALKALVKAKDPDALNYARAAVGLPELYSHDPNAVAASLGPDEKRMFDAMLKTAQGMQEGPERNALLRQAYGFLRERNPSMPDLPVPATTSGAEQSAEGIQGPTDRMGRPAIDQRTRSPYPPDMNMLLNKIRGVESGGVPGQVSSKGAQGVYQMMPETYGTLRGKYAPKGLPDVPYEQAMGPGMEGVQRAYAGRYLQDWMDQGYTDPKDLITAYYSGAPYGEKDPTAKLAGPNEPTIDEHLAKFGIGGDYMTEGMGPRESAIAKTMGPTGGIWLPPKTGGTGLSRDEWEYRQKRGREIGSDFDTGKDARRRRELKDAVAPLNRELSQIAQDRRSIEGRINQLVIGQGNAINIDEPGMRKKFEDELFLLQSNLEQTKLKENKLIKARRAISDADDPWDMYRRFRSDPRYPPEFPQHHPPPIEETE